VLLVALAVAVVVLVIHLLLAVLEHQVKVIGEVIISLKVA
jgi:hypothetical protein